MTKNAERRVVQQMLSPTKQGHSSMVQGHFYYINFERYTSNTPVIWFNLVRDPVDQFISQFYYLRTQRRWKLLKARPPQVRHFKKEEKCTIF